MFPYLRRTGRVKPFGGSVPKSITLALAVLATSAAQGPLPPIPLVPDSNAIVGFETTTGWIVKSNSISTSIQSTTKRTQGHFAYALINPPDQTTMTSLPVSSTAAALASIGEPESILELDVMLPLEEGNRGSLKLSVSSPSRGLANEFLGQVDLAGFRTGIYNTLQFPVTDNVRSTLGGVVYKDLTFEFVLSYPPTGIPAATTARQYLFDNLRAHSAPLVTAKTGTRPPAGYGGSVDLVAIGEEPADQSFDLGAVQVPDGFHLTQGTAGTTSVTLALGTDRTPVFTCTYEADASDTTGHSYALKSCTGGVQAGDLVAAGFAHLNIVGGTIPMKIEAQLARNPVGDLLGSGVIPPMPTFWGDFESCTPALVKGQVHTTSASCDSQVAHANQIVTDYFNKVVASKAAPNWIVTPVPEGARRHGNGLPNPNAPRNTPLDPTTNDFPFDQSGHVNQGGDFDAYWRLNGDLNTVSDSSGNETNQFDAEFSGHVVLFGQDINVVSLQATAQTSSGVSPSASGSVHMFVLGIELPGGGSGDANTGFNFNISQTQDVNVFSVHYWIFALEAGVTFQGGVDTTGTLAPTGFNLSVTPDVDMGAHIFGGVDIGIASGGVDARVDLLKVSAPVTAQAGVFLNTNPQSCSLTVNLSLNGLVTVSSLGGEIDLTATFGDCPICYSTTHTVHQWDAITQVTQPLFSVGPINLAAVRLPTSFCPLPPFHVTIQAPGATVPQILPQKLVATTDNSAGTVNCTWTGFGSSDTPPAPQGCIAQATFSGLGPRTLTVDAVNTVTDIFGRQFTGPASASKNIDVANLPPGDYFTGTNPAEQPVCAPNFGCSVPQAPFNGQTLTIGPTFFPANIQIFGEVIPSAGTITTFTATDSNGTTTTLTPPRCINPLVCGGIGFGGSDPDAVSAIGSFPHAGLYTITMTTKDSGGRVTATATMQINVVAPPR